MRTVMNLIADGTQLLPALDFIKIDDDKMPDNYFNE